MRAYLSGKMTGEPDFNYPLFNQYGMKLRKLGYSVCNPAETFKGDQTRPIAEYALHDTEEIIKFCDRIYLVPGNWHESKGCKAEIALALWLGKPIFCAETLEPLSINIYPQILENPDDLQVTKVVVPSPAGPAVEPTGVSIDVPAHTIPAVPTPTIPAGEVRVTNEKTGGQKGSKPEMYSLIPVDPIAAMARVYYFGTKKYEPNNWRKGYAWSLCLDSLERHYKAFLKGESLNAESVEHHLAHVMWHCCTLMEFEKLHPDLDDRPEVHFKKGVRV